MDLLKKSGSLFKKQKDDPEFLVGQGKKRLSLLKNLSRAIKETQLVHANQEQGQAIGDCRASHRLCTRFEEVLRHGLKAGWFGGKPSSFWAIVLQVSRKQAIEYIKSLQYAQSENGKCRAWIRLAVNECSLESYINVICQDSSLLSQYYEVYSFVQDKEMVDAMRQLLTGLSELTFNITVDTASLEFEAAPEALQPALRLQPALQGGQQHSKPMKAPRHRHNPVPEKHKYGSVIVEDSDSEWSSLSEEGISLLSKREETSFVDSGSQSVPPSSFSAESSGSLLKGSEDGDQALYEPEPCTQEVGGDKGHSIENSIEEVYNSSCVIDAIDSSNSYTVAADAVHLEGSELVHQMERIWPEELTSLDKPRENGQGEETSLGERSEESLPNEQREESLPDEQREESLPDEQREESLPDEQREESLPDEQREESLPDEQREESLPDERRAESWPDERREESSPDERREESLPDERREESSPDERREESLRDERREESLPDERREESLPDERREESLPDERREESLRDERRAESWPDERKEESWLDEQREESSPGQRREESWLDEHREESSPDERREESWPDEHREERRRSLEGESLNPFDSTTPDGHDKSMEELLGGRNPFDIYQVPNTEVATNACTHSPTPTRLLDDSSDGRDNPIDYTTDLKVQHTGAISTNPFDSPEHSSQPADPGLKPPIGQLYASTTAPDADILSSNHPEDFLLTADDDERHFTSASPPGNFLLRSPNESAPSSTADSASELAEEILISQVDFDGSFHSSAGLEWSVMLERVLTSPSQTPLNEATPTDPNQLPILEDYYTAEVSMEELPASIEQLKLELSSLSEEGRKQDIRKRIVQLQLKLQRMKEESISVAFQEVCGHKFVCQSRQTWVMTGVVCEGCGKKVRGLIRSWYKCKKCSCACHKPCLSRISRMCVDIKEEMGYVLQVCPEKGLTNQHFRCDNCNRAFNQPPLAEARLCDYSGLYYCSECHQNGLSIIPARVLHNWDFTPRKVCSHCVDLLERLSHKPLMKIQAVNPLLYTYVQDLATIEALRRDMLHMKQYFVQCKAAIDAHLLQKLDRYPHFKEDSMLFSLQDMVEAHAGTLLPELQEIHRIFAHHIRHDCMICSGKGFCCEVCRTEEILYPFDRHVILCNECKATFHKTCLTDVTSCPRCLRVKRKKSQILLL